MRITTDLFYTLLGERFNIERLGRPSMPRELLLPVFYVKDVEPEDGALYIARSIDLPARADRRCTFVCCGSRPRWTPLSGPAEVLYITDEGMDVVHLMNCVLEIFQDIGDWIERMRSVLEEKAGIAKLVEVSIPIFQNRISVTDYSMRVIAQCVAVEQDGKRWVEMSDQVDRIPVEISRHFAELKQDTHQRREPYTIHALRGDSGEKVDHYCINLFIGNVYAGVCTLCEDYRPVRASDYALFQAFARFASQALSAQQTMVSRDIVPIKAILSDVLDNYPVSERDLNQALNLVCGGMRERGQAPGTWHAVTVKSANQAKTLPIEYVCGTLEEKIPNSFAVGRGDHVALLMILEENQTIHGPITDALQSYLTDMHFLAGVSSGFTDLFKARRYYLQALVLLETGEQSHGDENLFLFESGILRYMLKNSSGILDREQLLSDGLRALRDRGGSVDYLETLKCYLDTECNASQTAQNLYLHRSTLLPRLDTIQKYVSLDTPEERLYLRMCLYILQE